MCRFVVSTGRRMSGRAPAILTATAVGGIHVESLENHLLCDDDRDRRDRAELGVMGGVGRSRGRDRFGLETRCQTASDLLAQALDTEPARSAGGRSRGQANAGAAESTTASARRPDDTSRGFDRSSTADRVFFDLGARRGVFTGSNRASSGRAGAIIVSFGSESIAKNARIGRTRINFDRASSWKRRAAQSSPPPPAEFDDDHDSRPAGRRRGGIDRRGGRIGSAIERRGARIQLRAVDDGRSTAVFDARRRRPVVHPARSPRSGSRPPPDPSPADRTRAERHGGRSLGSRVQNRRQHEPATNGSYFLHV